MRRVKFRVGVGRVSVPAPPAAEHHVTPGHRALVHLPQVDRTEVDLESALVAERLQADITLHSLLPRGRVDEGGPEVVEHGIEVSAVAQRSPAGPGVSPRVPRHCPVTAGLHLLAPAEVDRIEHVLLLRLPLRLVVEPRGCQLVLIWREAGAEAGVAAERGRNWVAGQTGLVESHRAHRGRNWFLHWRPAGNLGSSPLRLPVIKGMHAL